MFMLASVSFWTVRAQGIVWGYYNLFNIARMPDEAFRGAFKAVFTFALPVLLVSNVPVRVLADKLTSPVACGGVDRAGNGLGVDFGMVLAVLHPPLHQREHVGHDNRSGLSVESPCFHLIPPNNRADLTSAATHGIQN